MGKNSGFPKMSARESERFGYEFQIGLARAILSATRPDVNAMEMLGNALTRLGRHHEALEVDRTITRLMPESEVAHYNLACSLSCLSQSDQAFAELSEAVRLGYSDIEHLKADPDLAAIRRDPRFAELIDQIAASKKGSV